MAVYNFKDHVSGDTFNGLQVTLTNQNGSIDLTGASISLVTTRKINALQISTKNKLISIIDPTGGVFKINEQRINWEVGVYNYALKIVFPNGRIKTYLTGTWKIV